MSDISFKSTFKISVSQWGVNNSKKLQLKSLVSSYNGVVTKGKEQTALVSISDKKDFGFIRKLKKIGYCEFKQIEGENIKKESLEDYVKNFFKKNL